MLSPRRRPPQRAHAVIVDGAGLVGDLRQVVDFVLVGIQLAHREIRNFDIENPEIARDVDVVVDYVREPYQVVGESSAYATSALRVPPVLDVSFDELPARSADYVVARD